MRMRWRGGKRSGLFSKRDSVFRVRAIEQDAGVIFVDEVKAPVAFLVFIDVGFLDVEPPTVDAKAPFAKAITNDWIGFEVLHLLQHIELRKKVMRFQVCAERILGFQHFKAVIAVTEPAREVRSVGAFPAA